MLMIERFELESKKLEQRNPIPFNPALCAGSHGCASMLDGIFSGFETTA
jgi:hypothetical protein